MLCFIPPPQKLCANPNPENPVGFSCRSLFRLESSAVQAVGKGRSGKNKEQQRNPTREGERLKRECFIYNFNYRYT